MTTIPSFILDQMADGNTITFTSSFDFDGFIVQPNGLNDWYVLSECDTELSSEQLKDIPIINLNGKFLDKLIDIMESDGLVERKRNAKL